ncbi:MAG TPA: histidine kinase dimerization/phospho-acceptor domain-containing protein, partial [Acetobacteraceae bacterium]|nr:histidine kinase dimerization/phospho-acceptor domain-containing protein [Acetobacteraceae bacterium]
MSCVRLTDLPRTTSFRLALLFLLLFGAASLVLFSFIYVQTRSYHRAQVDDWLRREHASFARLDRGEVLERLSARTIVDPAGERPFILFDAAGKRLQGTPLDVRPEMLAGTQSGSPFSFMVRTGGEAVRYRALANRLPSGEILLVAQDLTAWRDFDELLVNSMLWGGLVTLTLGLAGALIAGTDAVHRIDAVTLATQRIVSGDLSQRLPARGGLGDLDRLAGVINGMLGEIEHLMKEVKAAGDNIAHDLRTPLTRLLAGLERARRRSTSAQEYAAAVDEAIRDIHDILETFSALLRIAEVESGARRAGFTMVDLATVAADVVEFYEPMAEERGIELHFVESGALAPMMPGDPSLLFEALGNLVDNALKYTPRGAQVCVYSVGEGGRPGFEVTDGGPGIPPPE